MKSIIKIFMTNFPYDIQMTAMFVFITLYLVMEIIFQGIDINPTITYKESMKVNTYTECIICGCAPRPGEWSTIQEGVCFDCGQYLVYANNGNGRISYYLFV